MDRLTTRMQLLLDCVTAELDPPVCKEFLHPGAVAPWDVCETGSDGSNGQAWVLVTQLTPGFPDPDPTPMPCPQDYTAHLEVGVIRCAQGTIGDNGDFPPGDLITADAELIHLDRVVVNQAIFCCWDEEPRDIAVDNWLPLGPEGGCVGGAWQIRIPAGRCRC